MLIISFVYGFQHILWLQEHHWDIPHIIFITSFEAWDSDHYAAKIQDIYEGHWKLSNAYLAEHKDTVRSPWQKFPYFLSAGIAKLLHIKVPFLIVLMDFVLPPVIFVLAYQLLFTLGMSRRISLASAFIFTLVPNLVRMEVFPLVLHRLLRDGAGVPLFMEAHQGYGFSRTINPQLTFIFLLSALIFFFKAILSSRRRDLFFSILFGIVLSYSYIYFSTYLH